MQDLDVNGATGAAGKSSRLKVTTAAASDLTAAASACRSLSSFVMVPMRGS